MSHFTVVVIGPDPEEQLAPFSENLEVEPYYEPADDYDVERAEAGLQILALSHPELEHIQHLANWLNEEEGDDTAYKVVDSVLCSRSTRNPKSKWDYCTLGGRWKDFFPQLRGKNKDTCLKKNVDFAKARAKARAAAIETFDTWEEICAGSRPRSWPEVLKSFGEANVGAARTAYYKQPIISDERTQQLIGMGCPVETFGFDRDAYIDKCEARVLVPYAILLHGEWLQKGEMGWFGMSNDTVSQEDWNKKVHDLYESLDGDTPLSLYDCHI